MNSVDYINIYTGIILLIFLTPAGVLWYYEPEQLGITQEQKEKDLKNVLSTLLILSPIFLRGLGIV
jgi:hypothetical protein